MSATFSEDALALKKACEAAEVAVHNAVFLSLSKVDAYKVAKEAAEKRARRAGQNVDESVVFTAAADAVQDALRRAIPPPANLALVYGDAIRGYPSVICPELTPPDADLIERNCATISAQVFESMSKAGYDAVRYHALVATSECKFKELLTHEEIRKRASHLASMICKIDEQMFGSNDDRVDLVKALKTDVKAIFGKHSQHALLQSLASMADKLSVPAGISTDIFSDHDNTVVRQMRMLHGLLVTMLPK